MSHELEAAADVATGALAARAVDGPVASGGAHGHDGTCLNCGTELTGPYCHACGQAAHTHRTLMGFLHDILHGVFHFEGRLWHTLPLLIFKPGQLTRRYIDGERIRFISPVALFLFMVFLTFAVLNFGGASEHGKSPKAVDTTSFETKTRAEMQAIDALESKRAQLIADGKPTTEVDARLKEVRNDLDLVKSARAMTEGKAAGPVDIHTDIPALDHTLNKIAENPGLFLYKLQSSAYKFLWLLIPISLPFLWLMFAWRRDVALYDHAVFATYSLSAMMLLLIVSHVLGLIGVPGGVLALAIVLIPPLHMYKQLRGAYGVGRFGAIWRVGFLLVSAGVSSLIFLMILLQMLASH